MPLYVGEISANEHSHFNSCLTLNLADYFSNSTYIRAVKYILSNLNANHGNKYC